MQKPIYLDYMATTPVDHAVAEAMQNCLAVDGVFGNPASRTHKYGWQAQEAVEAARRQVANLINAKPREIIWTSGATEADNLALKGAAQFYQRKGKHIISMSTEHKAVLDSLEYLAAQGFEITLLDPELDGRLDLNKLAAAIRSDTILISIMHVNNETGVIQDLDAIGKLLQGKGIVFHVDAAQSAARIAIDVEKLPVDLMSFSAHKAYGPKGMGALYVRREPRVRLQPQIHGGGHEYGLRSGTLATHQIVGMGKAFELIKTNLEVEEKSLEKMSSKLWRAIEKLGDVTLNGNLKHKLSNCLNICFANIDAEALILTLPDMAISSSSACSSGDAAPSHVLLAMGLSRQAAYSSLRISLGRFTSEADIDYVISYLTTAVKKIRQQGSAWDKINLKEEC
ncbi:MAG: IscS subfamily cysteine desulfurase [Gammaproteobacteria bacterium]|nr:IscS subfamily cysteine desulfurase [Gammaproteobacteria bacterium]